jgi:AP-1 complex subunit gamma-1
MSIKLRELIRAVRACKTAQEERAVIAKECALIRTAFKDNALLVRHRNVAKLLFIHMLGYPSHFGQMECLKLIASPNFPEKRIGYLALMLLLDERTEVLTLVTNSLKNDLKHESQYVVGLALTSVGNLATADMGRVLAADVALQLASSNPYVRKKASLALVRILKRVPELAEDYVDRIISLLKDRSHGVLITAVQLVADVLIVQHNLSEKFVRIVPLLVKMLRNLLNLGYSPEHDIAGIADPFLQVKILQLLAMLGRRCDEASDAMNDVLAQVATNTETNRNAGNAILYECVKAIMGIESESGLKVLAVNILGRFLLNRDNNIRYVALNSLSKVVSEDVAAVQRHRATILECLKDPDVSIRQRALELTYQLVDLNNVKELVREMLNYLVVAAPEHRALLCGRVSTVVERFAPSAKWQIETLITVLSIAGNHCDDSIACLTVCHVIEADSLHSFATHKLFRLLRDDLPRVQIALMHVAVWCIGEYGDHLLRSCETDTGCSDIFEAIAVAEIHGILEAVLRSHLATVVTKSYTLTALMKLSNRLNLGRMESVRLIDQFNSSLSLELHQRSCEYISMLDTQWADIRLGAFARIPPVREAAIGVRHKSANAPQGSQLDLEPGRGGASDEHVFPASDLLDLDGIFNGVAQSERGSSDRATTDAANSSQTADVDLLADIFTATIPIVNKNEDHDFNSSDLALVQDSAVSSQAPGTRMQVKAFEKDGLVITMDLVKDPANSSIGLVCKFFNYTHKDFERFIFQAAVPKYVSMEMKPATASYVSANSLGDVFQVIKLENTSPAKPLMMRLKIQYTVGGRQIVEQTQVSSFPI